VSRLSRFCDVRLAHADVPGFQCKEITIEDVKPHVLTLEDDKVTTEQKTIVRVRLKELSTHRCMNSLWDVDTGGQESLPLSHDLMHILSTVMKTVFTLLVSPMSASEKSFPGPCCK
jgi:hypothetical protein